MLLHYTVSRPLEFGHSYGAGRETRPIQCCFDWPVKFQLFRLLHKIDSLPSIVNFSKELPAFRHGKLVAAVIFFVLGMALDPVAGDLVKFT